MLVLLEAGAVLLTLAAFGLFLLLDNPRDDRVSRGWLERARQGRGQL
jgi:hypothetical protein